MTQARDLADGKFDTNTLVVDAANNRVGVGTTSPADHLAVVTSGANAQLSVDRSDGATGRTVLIHSSSGGQLQTTGSAPLIFGTADTERGRFLSGGGLTFNGDTATANALDDYEEGTWTPALDFGGGTTGITYSTQVGKYTKIGNLVVVSWRIYLANKGSSTGHAHVGGFPYQLSGLTGGVFQYISNRGGLSLSDEHAYLYFEGANTRFSVYQGDNDGTGNSTVSESAFGNSTELEGFMQYTTSS